MKFRLGLLVVGAIGLAGCANATPSAQGFESGVGPFPEAGTDRGSSNIEASGLDGTAVDGTGVEASLIDAGAIDSSSTSRDMPLPVDMNVPTADTLQPIDSTPADSVAITCDILTQACPTGLKCVEELSTSGTASGVCVAAGSKGQGSPCSAVAGGGDTCAKGLVCLGSPGTCFSYCSKCDAPLSTTACTSNPADLDQDSASYCQTGSDFYCFANETWSGNQVIASICDQGCNVFNPSCKDPAGVSGGCYLVIGGAACIATSLENCGASSGCAPGTVPDGAACSSAGDCVKGDSCLGGTCIQTCKVGASGQCSLGGTCHAIPGTPEIPNIGECF
jgi:hypothetical protein